MIENENQKMSECQNTDNLKVVWVDVWVDGWVDVAIVFVIMFQVK